MNGKKIGAVLVGFLSVVYLLNPTLGIFEFIPDNIPGFGNLDEGAAGALLIWAISVLRRKKGTEVPPLPPSTPPTRP